MCGIAAVLKRESPIGPADRASMDALLEQMGYRGPDSADRWCRERTLLGHRRLSIIDLSEAGRQPQHVESAGVHVTYNGEIYNYRELRRELESSFDFRTESDTEVLLAAYRRYGPEFVQRLRGMFACVLIDDRAGTAMLVRDRLGKKPLYYLHDADRLIATSEIKGLHAFRGTNLTLDAESVRAFFSLQYIPGPFTIYEQVRRVMPGEMVVLDLETWRLDRQSYWSATDLSERPGVASLDELDELIRQSVQYRLVADVEVGVLLSGGIDSTLISWYAQQSATQPLRAFNVAFGNRDLDESPYARAAAQALGMQIVVENGDAIDEDMFRRVAFHADEPLGDPACLPTFAIARALSQHVKVVLSGEGADELFWGYPHYRQERLLGWLPTVGQFGGSGFLGRLGAALEGNPRVPGAVARLAKVLSSPKALGAARWTSVFGPLALERLMPGLASQRSTPRFVQQFAQLADSIAEKTGRGRESSLLDLAFWLPDDLLVKVDRMTMAHSVEARAPFLDHHLVEAAIGIPERQRAGWRTTKRMLRRLLRERLPPSIAGLVANRKKHGFEVPIGNWLSGPLRGMAEEAFNSGGASGSGLVDRRYARALWNRFSAGQANHGFSRKLWLLLCFTAWHEQHREHFGFRA